jgi:signal transduction histidine kinase
MNSPAVHSRVAPPNNMDVKADVSTGFWQSPKGSVLRAIIATVLIFFVSSGADLFMFHEHEPARLTIELSDAISSIVVGLLCYQLFRLQRLRRQELRRRVEMISDMNHHVRNALQVISLSTHGHGQDEIKNVRDSVNRIQWALRELLPKI